MQSSVTNRFPSSISIIASTGHAFTHSLSFRHLSVSITYGTLMISSQSGIDCWDESCKRDAYHAQTVNYGGKWLKTSLLSLRLAAPTQPAYVVEKSAQSNFTRGSWIFQQQLTNAGDSAHIGLRLVMLIQRHWNSVTTPVSLSTESIMR
jgi:hypothetical protein